MSQKQQKCDARLSLADDFGDNPLTFQCELLMGHEGAHKEEFERDGSPVTITWYVDEREQDMHSTNISSGD